MLLMVSAEMLLLMAAMAREPEVAVMVAPACSIHSSIHRSKHVQDSCYILTSKQVLAC
jgi:hypothetical protein